MPKGRVAGVILHGDELIIGKKLMRKDSELGGVWNIPIINRVHGESDVDTLQRMAQRGFGIRLVGDYKYISSLNESWKDVKWYECHADSRELVCGSGWAEAEWIRRDRVFERVGRGITKLWPKEVMEYFKGRAG